MITTWGHDPGIVSVSNVLITLNDALSHSAVLVQVSTNRDHKKTNNGVVSWIRRPQFGSKIEWQLQTWQLSLPITSESGISLFKCSRHGHAYKSSHPHGPSQVPLVKTWPCHEWAKWWLKLHCFLLFLLTLVVNGCLLCKPLLKPVYLWKWSVTTEPAKVLKEYEFGCSHLVIHAVIFSFFFQYLIFCFAGSRGPHRRWSRICPFPSRL